MAVASSQRSRRRSRAADFPAPVEGDFVARDFRFGTGETLPALNLHYRTIGTPQRDASGVVRNAVLILHGTGGTGAGFLSRTFGGELFGAGPAARRDALLHHPARRHRPRQVEQAERRPARALPEVHLRRHGPRAARDAGRRPEGEPPAAGDRHVDGRDALLGLGRDVSRLRRRPGAAGQRADADRRAQPRDAQDDHGQHHAAIRRGRTATTPSSRTQGLVGADQPADDDDQQPAAVAQVGRRRATPPTRGTRIRSKSRIAADRRERHAVPVQRVARLRSVAEPREDHGAAPRHQLGGRCGEPAGAGD